ncbi:hypothetical protein D9619_011128 [Psilocybe cf. subviscida]|uniref:Uncharacterized protein n=1 Tax=Psilocybe cf. subviscida TaxID=2480587 RepID=A0A8H5F5I9_9AGAR|nr:hypothetical protein D9619_011128 [Psilocybe cf. subviscida]
MIMESTIIYSGGQTCLESLFSVDEPVTGMIISNSIASLSGGMDYGPLVTQGTKADMDAVSGLYVCDNTAFTSFASLVSLTAGLDANVLDTPNKDLNTELDTEDFDFFGFGSSFRAPVRPEAQEAEEALSEVVVDKYPFLAGPLVAALELGDDSSLVLDAAMSRSAESIFSADSDTAEGGARRSTGPTTPADASEPPLSTATQTGLSSSSASVYPKDTAPSTPYITPQLVSASKVPLEVNSLMTLTTPLKRNGDILAKSQTAVLSDVDHQRKMDATIAFEQWRHACLALAAFPSTVVGAYVPHIEKPEIGGDGMIMSALALRLDVASDTIPSTLSTQIEPVSKPGALRGSKHLQLLLQCRFSQSPLRCKRRQPIKNLDEPAAPALSASSSGLESLVVLGQVHGYGHDSMPSFTAVMAAFVSDMSPLPSLEAFVSIPSSLVLGALSSTLAPSSSVRSISSTERLPGLLSTETEYAALPSLPIQMSTNPNTTSSVKAHLSNLHTRENIKQPSQPLMVSYPSIHLAKRRLGTIHEATPPHAHSISFSHPLSTSRSGPLSMSSSESAVIVTHPPSTSPYSPNSMIFDSMAFDHTPDVLVGHEAPGDFPLSMSPKYGHECALEELLLSPLLPLAVSRFPCPPPLKSRFRFTFPRIPISVSRITSRSPVIFDAQAVPVCCASRPLSGQLLEAKIAHTATPGRLQNAIRRIKAFF